MHLVGDVVCCFMSPRPPRTTLFPYTTLFRSYKTPNDSIIIHGPVYAESKRGDIGREWWGQQWVEVMERSEEHTSELQSRENLVCRLLLEKKKKNPVSQLCNLTFARTPT